MTTSQRLQQRYADSLMNTFGPPRLVLVKGEGPYVWDAEGTRYLDLLGGIAVNALGHAHPALVRAVTGQLATLGHVSNFFATEPQVTLAEKLISLLGLPDGGARCSSATPAPRPTRPRSSSPGAPAAPTWWRWRVASTAAPWAHSR